MHFVHFTAEHDHVKYYPYVLVRGDKARFFVSRQTQLQTLSNTTPTKCCFANIFSYMYFPLSPSITITLLLVPITVWSYHPLECPTQVFHPTGGTETSASLSQTEECF